MVDPVPDGEVVAGLLIHLEEPVEFGQRPVGVQQDVVVEGARAQQVVHGDRHHGGLHTVAGHVDEVDDEMVVVDPAVVEAVAAEFLGGHVAGGDRHRVVHVAGQDGGDVAGGAAEFGHQPGGLRLQAAIEAAVLGVAFGDLGQGQFLGRHLLVDDPERRNGAVGSAVGLVEALDVQMNPVRHTVGAPHPGPALVPAVEIDRRQGGAEVGAVLGRDEFLGANPDPVAGRSAEGFGDRPGYPADRLVADAHHYVGHVVCQQPEPLLRQRDAGGQLRPLGDVAPGQADEILAGLGGADVVVAQIAEQFAVVGDSIEDYRLAGVGAVDEGVHQPGFGEPGERFDQAVPDQFRARQSEVTTGGAVDFAVHQIDDRALGTDRLHQYLWVEHRVGTDPQQVAHLACGLDRLRQSRVVVEHPHLAVEPVPGSNFADDPQMGGGVGELPGGLQFGVPTEPQPAQFGERLRRIARPAGQPVDGLAELRSGGVAGRDSQNRRGRHVDVGEVMSGVHRDQADVQLVEQGAHPGDAAVTPATTGEEGGPVQRGLHPCDHERP